MKTSVSTAIFIALVLGFLLGAVAHEADIQATCKCMGRSGYSAWMGEIKCSPLNKEK